MNQSGTSASFNPGQKVGGGRYVLIRELGRGGMGVVWLAHDNRLEEDLALKFIPAEVRSDAAALDDLRRETLKCRKLSHPNILRIHDLNESPDESPFISMEFIDGTPLNKLKATQPQRLFTWDYLKPLIKQLCEALDYAHTQKVIHRDLKPGNIMLTAGGVLKLADFGLAASMSDSISRTSHNLGSSGTPAYMSPQQMRSQVPKVTDDIYALGATLYELLTSKPPFYTGDIYRQVKEEPPTPLAGRLADLELRNDIPADVAALIMACLAKDPERRPQSAGAVAEWIGLDVGKQHPKPGMSLLVEREPDRLTKPPLEAMGKAPTDLGRKALRLGVSLIAIVLLLLGGWAVIRNRSKGEASVGSQGMTFDSKATGDPAAGKDDVSFNGHRYRFVPGKVSWTEASLQAQALGGHLATVSSREENAFLIKEFGPRLNKDFKGIWLGLSQSKKDAPWRWVTGEPVTFTGWMRGEPNFTRLGGNWPFYVNLYRADGREVGWNDNAATGDPNAIANTRGFIAEWEDTQGFVSLFNGRDLTGWRGDPRFWSVEDGAIKGESHPGNTPEKDNTYLFWTGGVVSDFELHFSYKLIKGETGSGVLYRGKDMGNWHAQGYHADFWPAGVTLLSGNLAYEAPGRGGRPGTGPLALSGEKVVWGADGWKQVVGSTDRSTAEIRAAIKERDWNDYVVTARGGHLVHQINGNVTVDVMDNDVQRRFLSGILGLKMRPNKGEAMRVYFKDIRLKSLEPMGVR